MGGPLFRGSASPLVVGLLLGVALIVGCAGADPRPNVVLVVIDTAGARAFGAWTSGDEPSATPSLDAFAATGVRFAKAFAPAPWTQPSVASLLTGRLPHQHGVTSLLATLDDDETTLPERLADAGYATGAVVSHHLIGERFGFHQGFDAFDGRLGSESEGITGVLATNRALGWLDRRERRGSRSERRRPFFLLVHYFDPHVPYLDHDSIDAADPTYSGPFRAGLGAWELRGAIDSATEHDRDQLRALHREEVAFTDEQVGRLLLGLEARGLDRRTIVVLVADHGEELLERGWIGHTIHLHDELLHVPLVVRLPDAEPRVVDEPVSLVDVAPTLAELTGVDLPAGTGRSLVPLLRGGPGPSARDLFAEVTFRPLEAELERRAKTAFATALLRGDLKLVHDLTTDRFALYDRASDPGERIDVLEGHPEGDAMMEALRRFEAAGGGRVVTTEPATADDETLEQLRALGYVR